MTETNGGPEAPAATSPLRAALLACGSVLGMILLLVVVYLGFMAWASAHSRSGTDCSTSSPATNCATHR